MSTDSGPTGPGTALETTASPPLVVGWLKKRAEFLRLRGGARAETPSFVLEGKPVIGVADPGEVADATPAAPASCRFGFTITKKLGNAVARNRMRRRLREVVRKVAPARARACFDYVIVARPAVLTRDFADLCRDLESALARAHRRPAGADRASPSARKSRPQSTGGAT